MESDILLYLIISIVWSLKSEEHPSSGKGLYMATFSFIYKRG